VSPLTYYNLTIIERTAVRPVSNCIWNVWSLRVRLPTDIKTVKTTASPLRIQFIGWLYRLTRTRFGGKHTVCGRREIGKRRDIDSVYCDAIWRTTDDARVRRSSVHGWLPIVRTARWRRKAFFRRAAVTWPDRSSSEHGRLSPLSGRSVVARLSGHCLANFCRFGRVVLAVAGWTRRL